MDGRPDSSKAVTSTTITLLPPPAPEPALPTTTIPQYVGPGQSSNRMTRVLAILQAEPERLWRSREIAEPLGDVTLVATYRQLARWTEKGMIKRVRTGRYAAVTQETAPLA
jgi:predicted transcriptional regulator of viral defense system